MKQFKIIDPLSMFVLVETNILLIKSELVDNPICRRMGPGVHLRGGEGGPLPPPRIQVSYFFLQSYYEMIKGIHVQHVHVL